MCVFVCVWRDVEGERCWALSFESQVTTLLFQRTPLVFIILPSHQLQGTQPHAWTRTSWWETECTPQVFWPVKISLLVWHFLSCPDTPTLPTPFYTWAFVLLWKETYISPVCQAPLFQWPEWVCHQLQLVQRFLSVEPTITGVRFSFFNNFLVSPWYFA